MNSSKVWICGGGGIGMAVNSIASTEKHAAVHTTSHRYVDVTNPDRIANFLVDYGPFTHVVYTAGHNELSWVQHLTEEKLHQHMATNVYGLVYVLAALRETQDPCRVVAVTSDAARRPMRTSLAYCASKAAADMAVKCAAREMGPEGWRINAVAPGMTAPTGMSRSVDEQVSAIRGWSEEYASTYELSQSVIPRRAKPEEVARVVVDVAWGPDYLNGSIVEINGGR